MAKQKKYYVIWKGHMPGIYDEWTKAQEQIKGYQTFTDHGKGTTPPEGYKKIPVHLVFDVKYDLRRKARFVAGGHMTAPSKEDTYSSVVSLQSLRMCMNSMA